MWINFDQVQGLNSFWSSSRTEFILICQTHYFCTIRDQRPIVRKFTVLNVHKFAQERKDRIKIFAEFLDHVLIDYDTR